MADKAATAATELDSPHAEVTYNSICSHIKQVSKDPPPTHERTKRVYQGYSKSEEKEISNRSDQCLLAKLRSGHCKLLRAYHARLDPAVDPTCPLCEDGPQTLEHWLQTCAGTLERRISLFGYEDRDKLEVLTKSPIEALSLAKSTLFGDRDQIDPAH